jgi:hypothetical protein
LAFGIKREELKEWKEKVKNGELAYITHYWLDERFPNAKTVTKVGCSDMDKLIAWGKKHNIPLKFIDNRSGYPHFDLLGEYQIDILTKENMLHQLDRFKK